jgi:hypothetical protein
MKGIADGASAAGARFHGRRIDLTDIAAINSWPEIETLDGGLRAAPTPIEDMRFALRTPGPNAPPKKEHCSAFAATGPATRDGKVVFGHITMFSLYPSNFYNIWLDVKPARGQRVLMQSFPGGIHSGMDYYQNDAGILISETTIAQTRFDGKGVPLASRIRQAIQYADTIEKAVAILEKGNNGLYTNEWLLADVKTNEIAMFELGTHRTKLWRSSKDEWFGGTKGFYWGCNNTKDLDVRMETIPSVAGRPARALFVPSIRDQKWMKLYDDHKGKMDEGFGKLAFTTPPLAAFSSLDAKFTTTEMARRLESWALFGPPLGRTWQPTFEQRTQYPEVRPLVSNPWTVLHGKPPESAGKTLAVVDLHDPDKDGPPPTRTPHRDPETTAAWHGTVLARGDGDLWLATSFSPCERIVALEKALERDRKDGKLTPADRDRLAVARHGYRAMYELGARAGKDVPLGKLTPSLRDSHWHGVAQGKGVLLLLALRDLLGAETFTRAMDGFGTEHAGKQVTTADFRAHAEKTAGRKLDDFFAKWLGGTGLPTGASDGGPFAIGSFYPEVEQSLIVYGTSDDEAANREAAQALRQALRQRGLNVTVPLKSDRQVKDADLEGRHLLLVGRPAVNRVTARFRDALPVAFGEQSVVVRGEVYAHPDTVIVAAAENPLSPRYSLVVVAGLSALSTREAVDRPLPGGEVAISVRGKPSRSLVVPAKRK